VGKLQGPWRGTPGDLLSASRKGLKGLKMRGELRIPSSGKVLARNATPLQAFDALMKWHRSQAKKAKKVCS
jgi:hypothetical protein